MQSQNRIKPQIFDEIDKLTLLMVNFTGNYLYPIMQITN